MNLFFLFPPQILLLSCFLEASSLPFKELLRGIMSARQVEDISEMYTYIYQEKVINLLYKDPLKDKPIIIIHRALNHYFKEDMFELKYEKFDSYLIKKGDGLMIDFFEANNKSLFHLPIEILNIFPSVESQEYLHWFLTTCKLCACPTGEHNKPYDTLNVINAILLKMMNKDPWKVRALKNSILAWYMVCMLRKYISPFLKQNISLLLKDNFYSINAQVKIFIMTYNDNVAMLFKFEYGFNKKNLQYFYSLFIYYHNITRIYNHQCSILEELKEAHFDFIQRVDEFLINITSHRKFLYKRRYGGYLCKGSIVIAPNALLHLADYSPGECSPLKEIQVYFMKTNKDIRSFFVEQKLMNSSNDNSSFYPRKDDDHYKLLVYSTHEEFSERSFDKLIESLGTLKITVR